ncbi:probable alpha,alpha-trehalose-phosphate synthase [UDP-forming] 7 isoform X1 [Phragmites australis]|uniref:probable alpha,alpha-trehalose-phosphate synthase [UDP-forming] 7 isoform X1 n=1 Tax=Phragmites australis TaxID=29695 RepID=UPI002D76E843|nr:probable alpha,alpha-trehalose-phosphate synthase [UDP-forming] 7 isoform X1 [Phragmites australis]
MFSRSYTNLLDLANGNLSALDYGGGGGGGGGGRPLRARRMQRTMTTPGTLAELDEDRAGSVASDAQSSLASDRLIVVANTLPVRGERRPDGRGWSFCWDEDSLLFHLRDGLPDDMEVLYVGSLRADVPAAEQDDVAQALLERFRCVPAFLPKDLSDRFYHGFCKQTLWPLFHYMLPFSPDHGGRFDRSQWEAYVLANKLFSQRVIEVLNPEDDYVWIHDYHLLALPSFLRRRFNRLRIGFFLHSPFPSSELYRSLPVRDEILKSLLNCDLIGFHTFDYARHFLSCCSRMLGIEYQSKRGYIGLDYFGRTVGIKIMPVGINMVQLQSLLQQPDLKRRIAELRKQFDGKTVLLGVDDMDIFKGIDLKILAFEQMLRTHTKWQGRAVLVQISNPKAGSGKDLEDLQAEIEEGCGRINDQFGRPGYSPVMLVNRTLSSVERMAYYTIAECAIVTAVRDGMNLTPYEYIVCRQGIPGLDGSVDDGPRKSMLVVSEFIGCSPSLSGAIRVNPWNIESTAEAMNESIALSDNEKQLRHEKHYRYVSTHDVAYWSKSYIHDFERSCRDHFMRRCWGIGLGFGFRVVALDHNFRKLTVDSIVADYKKSKSRVILLDYDGTLVPQTTMNKTPNETVVNIMNSLCADKKNVVFIVSGRGRDSLEKWFYPCPELGIAAEHGYFMRWTRDEQWQLQNQTSEFGWMHMAKPVMKLYTEATDGSYIETKESAVVWHHQDADPGFGSSQAKEMLEHLESVLANEPVSVKSGQYIVEVKPQAVSKGFVAERILSTLMEKGREADFVLCIGDDRSDEDMFEQIADIMRRSIVDPQTSLFACTVGQKPSKAKYYLDDANDVLNMLEALADASDEAGVASPEATEGPSTLKQA